VIETDEKFEDSVDGVRLSTAEGYVALDRIRILPCTSVY
jgi:hypothetical protein